MISGMRIVLASGSPRRRELLEEAGLEFEVIPSSAEEVHDESMPLDELCELNAALKAEAVAADHPDALVIGSDTLVYIDETPLGKPADLDGARAMLRQLSGRSHRVCTAVCIMQQGGRKKVFHDTTEVNFKVLEDADIEDYIEKANTLDKAGAYGIQEHGELIVEGIEGRFDTVMGLPVEPVEEAQRVELLFLPLLLQLLITGRLMLTVEMVVQVVHLLGLGEVEVEELFISMLRLLPLEQLT